MYKSEHIITSRHYLVLSVTAFVIGVFTMLSFCTTFALLLLAAFALAFVVSTTYLYFSHKSALRKKYIIFPLILLAAFLLGAVRGFFVSFSDNTLKQYSGQEAWVYGTISSEPQLTASKHYRTFELDVFRVNDNKSVRETIFVYQPQTHSCAFHIGDNVFLWASLEEPYAQDNSFGYDYVTSLKGRNIFMTATARNINALNDYNNFSVISTLKYMGSLVRTGISNAADRLFADDPIGAAILKGILIGDKSGFTDEMYDKFSNSGISHIIAVSGLHMSILFSFLIILFGVISTNRRFLLLIITPFVLLFMSASAFTPSVCRASIMILIMIFARILSKEYDSITSLFAAFGILISVAPYSILSKSLVLSFSATFGILVYYQYINELLNLLFKTKNQNLRFFMPIIAFVSSSFSLSLASQIGTAYFLVLFFGKISKVQFLTNLWIIPLVSIIFCFGYISCVLIYVFPWLPLDLLRYPLDWCIEAIKFTINIFGSNRFAYNCPFDLSSFAYAAVYFGGALMLYMFLKTFRDIRTEKERGL